MIYGCQQLLACTLLLPFERTICQNLLEAAELSEQSFEAVKDEVIRLFRPELQSAIDKARSQGLGRRYDKVA